MAGMLSDSESRRVVLLLLIKVGHIPEGRQGPVLLPTLLPHGRFPRAAPRDAHVVSSAGRA